MANMYPSYLAGGGGYSGTAQPADVLSGETFVNSNGPQTGTMTNNGAVTATVAGGQSYTIPAGYHNGSGTVTGEGINPLSFNAQASPNNVATGTPNTFTLENADISVLTVDVAGYFAIYDVEGDTLTARASGDPSYYTITKSGTSLTVTQTVTGSAKIFIAYG